MPIIVVVFSFFISQITSTDVMLQLESSDATGDQMPDQVNLTFNTETKSLTKLNLRRSQYFNLDIPVYTVDTDSEGIMQRHKVETGHRKDIGFYQDIKNKAVFEIQKSPDTLASKKFKFNMKGEFLMNTSKYVFDSQKRTPKKPWRKPTFETFSDSRKSTPARSATFDPSVYTLELVTTPKFDSFDARVPPPEARKFVKLNSRIRRDKKLNSSGQNSRRPASQSRPRREAVKDYYIDVVALADYKLYSRFLTLANNNMTTAMQDILEHFAFTFNAADMLYQGIQHPEYTIHILLSKVFVFQTLEASSFIGANASYGYVDSEKALIGLEEFSKGSGHAIVSMYDHVMLFTGYTLYNTKAGGIKAQAKGFTYRGTLCQTDGRSCSVIEDTMGYSIFTIESVAHELAHSLSANHDGEVYPCNITKGYIMDDSDYDRSESGLNPWRFSNCSIDSITSFLEEKLNTSRGYTCLVSSIEAFADIPDVSDKLLGQVVKPDQQCQQLYGNESYFCRTIDLANSGEFCRLMSCRDTFIDGCNQHSALIGTSCGDGKICINGECVSDPYAPQVDDNCLFGDTPGPDCTSLSQGFCYDSRNYRTCCGSCIRISVSVKGCEYGDKKADCTADQCADSKMDCCGTCSYGTPFTPITSTKRTTPKRSTTIAKSRPVITLPKSKEIACEPGDKDLSPDLCTNISICQTQPTQCCNYCSLNLTSETTATTPTPPLNTTTLPAKCEPGDVDLSPELCHSPSVCETQPLLCCNYCSTKFTVAASRTTGTIPLNTTSNNVCEPGDVDLRPDLCDNLSICDRQLALCCSYCSMFYNSTTTTFPSITSPAECVAGQPDLRPELCTNSSICETNPNMCCNYCFAAFRSGANLSIYNIWIRCFYVTLHILYIKTVL